MHDHLRPHAFEEIPGKHAASASRLWNMQVRPHAFEEKPGKHAALETRIWKENEKGWPQALKGPHGRTRGRLPAAYRHYIKVVLPSR